MARNLKGTQEQRQRSKYTKYTLATKQLAVEKINQGIMDKDISLHLNIPRGTISSWRHTLDNGLSIFIGRRGGAHNVKTTPAISCYIKERIDDHCLIYYKRLARCY